MKKYLNIKLLAVALITFLGVSCTDDFFDQPAGNRINPDDHYKNSEDLIPSLNGINGVLQNAIPNVILLDGLLSDAMVTTSSASRYITEIEERIFLPLNPYTDASGLYKGIVDINELFVNIHKINELDKMDFDSVTLHATKGALVALRAYLYLNLVRFYGQAALIDGNLSKMPAGNQLMLSKEVMIDTLINQLHPYIFYDDTLHQVDLFLNNAVNPRAILGELYLEKNNYTEAIKFLKAAIESYDNNTALYKVDAAFSKEKWRNLFIASEFGNNKDIFILPESGNTELICGVTYLLKRGQSNQLTQWTMGSLGYWVKPSASILDLFSTQKPVIGKVDGDVFRGEGVSYKFAGINKAYINKYSMDEIEPQSAPIFISRAADLHLLLAEALNRAGQSDLALSILNKGLSENSKLRPKEYFAWSKNVGIRNRVGLQPRVPDASITDPGAIMLAIEDLIIEERAMELAFEGKRWGDLVRVAKRRNDPSYLANKVAAKFTDANKANAVKSKLMNQANWYLPLH